MACVARRKNHGADPKWWQHIVQKHHVSLESLLARLPLYGCRIHTASALGLERKKRRRWYVSRVGVGTNQNRLQYCHRKHATWWHDLAYQILRTKKVEKIPSQMARRVMSSVSWSLRQISTNAHRLPTDMYNKCSLPDLNHIWDTLHEIPLAKIINPQSYDLLVDRKALN